MYLYIIIGLLIILVVFTLNKQQSKEHLENCYLNVNNENKNGKISWKEFIPNGISAVQVFLERNKQ